MLISEFLEKQTPKYQVIGNKIFYKDHEIRTLNPEEIEPCQTLIKNFCRYKLRYFDKYPEAPEPPTPKQETVIKIHLIPDEHTFYLLLLNRHCQTVLNELKSTKLQYYTNINHVEDYLKDIGMIKDTKHPNNIQKAIKNDILNSSEIKNMALTDLQNNLLCGFILLNPHKEEFLSNLSLDYIF
jgi:hypothetical protein